MGGVRRIGRVAVILGAALLGLLLSYTIASTLGNPRADRVEPIELDLPPDEIVPSLPAVTVPTSAIVVPPITLPPPAPAAPRPSDAGPAAPTTPPPAPPDDEDGNESDDEDEEDDADEEDDDG